MGLFYATPSYPLPLKITKQTIHQLPTTYWPYMVNIKLHLYFPGWGWGWVGVVIIKLKANLSSTSHLTSQLELSLAIMYLSFQVSSMNPPATSQQLPPPTSLVHTSVLLSLQHQSLKRTQTAKQSIFCMSMVRIFCFPYSHQTSEYVPLTYVINLFFYFFFFGAFFIYWVWGTNKFLVQ